MKITCNLYQLGSGCICLEDEAKNIIFILPRKTAERFDLESIENFNLDKFLTFYEEK